MDLSTNSNAIFANEIDINNVWNKDLENFNMQENPVKDVNDFKPDSYDYIGEKALLMMSKMGFKTGEGLGQNNQGAIDPVNYTNNLGRRGLGHVVVGLEPAKLTWDASQEVIEVEETIHWLESCKNETKNCKYIEQNNLSDWLKIEQEKLTIADEIQYCDPILLQRVLKAKEVFDELDPIELCRARARANPFERIKSVFFMNRAALKMANIDAVTGFLLTGVDRQIEHKQSDSPYFFADICAGPGGFSEYILWRKRWAFKGFGLTLRGDHDFKLHESTCAPFETFEALYGVLDDGDIYYPDNIKDFCSQIKRQTNGEGVHFVMGDGGFSVAGQENIQEVLSKRLYVCQCYTALSALRPNGHFVVKMFDLFTPFSVGLLFLMYHSFHKIAIIKPNSSRPANSERYLVCSRLKNTKITNKIRNYLETIVHTLWDLKRDPTQGLDVYEMVPSHIIQDDQEFCQYITDSNNRLAQKQIIGLMKLATFCRDPTLIEPRQDKLKLQCLRYWCIPEKFTVPHLTIDELVPPKVFSPDFTFAKEFNSFQELNEILEEPNNWHCSFLASDKKHNLCNVYVGLGNNRVFRYQGIRWLRVKYIRLIKGTILFAEYVKDFISKGDTKVYKTSLHVIDALRLGDISLADLSYQERLDLIKIYCQSVNCTPRSKLAILKTKCVHLLPKLQISSLPIQNKEGNVLSLVSDCNKYNNKCCYITNSMLFLQTDSSQNFYSTMSTRLIVHFVSENQDSNGFKSSELWHNITNILRRSQLKDK